ncbi:GNAT family N-acetyltransferase [uncultured Nitratireductor sp.]|uniref:GNAT family N-acetyltransferase n=1 Tax=uncultured Nitratireductor sp. TaxID=520953 RepID=UPI0025F8EDA8|nr:GNAT family N-acetyltransferase [uncultured Nitratireductor sp.]
MIASHEHVPPLRTDRLVLRAPSERDIPAWFERATDRESAYLAGDPIPASISEGQAWLERALEKAAVKERLLWSIDIHGGPVSIGTVGLSLKDPGISFVIGRLFWGRGYATEAAREVLRFGFEVLGLSEVGSEFVVDNSGSRRVHEKLGFKYVEKFIDESDGAECERHILSKRAIEEQR